MAGGGQPAFGAASAGGGSSARGRRPPPPPQEQPPQPPTSPARIRHPLPHHPALRELDPTTAFFYAPHTVSALLAGAPAAAASLRRMQRELRAARPRRRRDGADFSLYR